MLCSFSVHAELQEAHFSGDAGPRHPERTQGCVSQSVLLTKATGTHITKTERLSLSEPGGVPKETALPRVHCFRGASHHPQYFFFIFVVTTHVIEAHKQTQSAARFRMSFPRAPAAPSDPEVSESTTGNHFIQYEL